MVSIKSLAVKLLAPIALRLHNYSDSLRVHGYKLGKKGVGVLMGPPLTITNPSLVFLDDYTKIQANSAILNYKGKFVFGKYSAASYNLVAVPDGHQSTVGIPHYLLGGSHVHDKVEDIVVEEDVWIGANVVLLGGAHLGRGSIIGAAATISRRTVVPPYAVMAGNPARIVAVKFSLEQIMKHEEKLYPVNERLSRTYLEQLFSEYYLDKHIFGTDRPLSETERQQLDNTIRLRNFQYPEGSVCL